MLVWGSSHREHIWETRFCSACPTNSHFHDINVTWRGFCCSSLYLDSLSLGLLLSSWCMAGQKRSLPSETRGCFFLLTPEHDCILAEICCCRIPCCFLTPWATQHHSLSFWQRCRSEGFKSRAKVFSFPVLELVTGLQVLRKPSTVTVSWVTGMF